MSIFLILWKNIPVFLSLLSFWVIVMYVSIERLYAGKFSFLHHSLLFYSLWTDFCLRDLAEYSFNSLVGHAKLSTTYAFPFFWKARAIYLSYMYEPPFSIALWIIYTRSLFSLVLLKIFWYFWNSSRNL